MTLVTKTSDYSKRGARRPTAAPGGEIFSPRLLKFSTPRRARPARLISYCDIFPASVAVYHTACAGQARARPAGSRGAALPRHFCGFSRSPQERKNLPAVDAHFRLGPRQHCRLQQRGCALPAAQQFCPAPPAMPAPPLPPGNRRSNLTGNQETQAGKCTECPVAASTCWHGSRLAPASFHGCARRTKFWYSSLLSPGRRASLAPAPQPCSPATCMGIGTKILSRFSDQAILISSPLPSHTFLESLPGVAHQKWPCPTPQEAWLAHQRRIGERQDQGREISAIASFADYVEISECESAELRSRPRQ